MMNNKFNNKIRTILSLYLLVATSGHLVSGQFLPQSHLGRLVQSIASPLMIAPGAYRETAEAEAPYPDPSSYYPQTGIPHQTAGGHPSQMSHGLVGQIQPEASGHEQHQSGRRLQMLQQAPSQHRRIPQHYYGQPMSDGSSGGDGSDNNNNHDHHHHHSQADQDDRDQGTAPSNNNNNKHGNSDYQMGAYLGPTIDDKEINGAFNSNNDDRDEDDGPSSYEGPTGRGQHKAASNAYNNNDLSGYGSGSPNSDESASSYGQQPSSAVDSGNFRMPQADSVSNYDEDGADEDEPSSVQGPRSSSSSSSAGGSSGRGRQSNRGLSQAASQYQQQGSNGAAHRAAGPMLAAANGYAPFGYAAGPVDLTGLMAGLNGAGDPNAGYQVYNGDGSYPGANYYQQQQQPGQRGARNQAASMSNYNTNDGYGPMQGHYGGQRANQDNDDDGEDD